MKIKIIFSGVLLIGISGVFAADMKAVTDSGKKVVLHDNGTWELEKAVVQKSAAGGLFKKSDAATIVTKGTKASYEIWVNPVKWEPSTRKLVEDADLSFRFLKGDAFGVVFAERTTIPLDTYQNVVLDNAKRAAPDAAITRTQDRKVNGGDIRFVEIRGTVQSINFVYFYYLATGPAGSVQAVVFTSEQMYEEYKTDMEEFLNGLVIK